MAKDCQCHTIGKIMAKQRRSSSSKSALQTVGGITAGIAVGAMGIPKIIETIDPEGKIDPKIINGVGAAGAFYFSRKQKGFVQAMLQGLAGGLAWNLVSAFVPSMGYVDDMSTRYLNNVAGSERNTFQDSRMNPGPI
jgi:hypothetical protein